MIASTRRRGLLSYTILLLRVFLSTHIKEMRMYSSTLHCVIKCSPWSWENGEKQRMRKVLLSLLLLFVATTMSAQTMLRGDMNNDGKITLADVNALADVLIGKAAIEAVSIYEVDNSTVIGTWYAADGTSLIFRADGTTNYPGGTTYEFMPILGRLIVYDSMGEIVKTMILTKVTPEYLLEENAVNGTLTYYTNSAYVVTSITLNRDSLSLNSGGTFLLQAITAPVTALNNGVVWSSSNEDVAIVNDNGMVTTIAGGTCTITCTAKDGGGASATCEVTVVQMVTDIVLSQTTLVLLVDGYKRLTATVLPSDASNQSFTWTSSDENIAEVTSNGLVSAVALGTCTITCSAKDGSGVIAICKVIVDLHECVDLGLPSGTLWATCNIGANSPEDYGDYFAWGETITKSDYSWNTYTYCNGSQTTMTKYCNNSSYGYNGFTDDLTELELSDDAAYMNWGNAWRMPSKTQFDELINSSYTTTIWTTQNGIYGRKITSKFNGNSIFLPVAGTRFGTQLYNKGNYGDYLSCTLSTSLPDYAYYIFLNSYNITYTTEGDYHRCYGRSVRPVLLSE